MSHNTIIHRIVRRPVQLAARTAVTPNHITTLRLLTGLLAACLFAAGSAPWMAIGGGVFILSMLLDRADGELARQTGQMSLRGYRYDLASDCIASVATFVGLGVGMTAVHGPASIWIGLLGGVGIGVLFFELNVLKLGEVRGYDLAEGLTVDPDDAMIFVPVLIWLGLAWPMTIAAAIITPLASLVLALIALRSRHVSSERGS
ncbi:MAG TPA: CDP-alcohol phosphatidyltransferase family protein [Sphingobium sp.]|uniref:CDP-alcohol phosphatidyltransferase family protein n=1 Tax=Sphingobium sp. TaxID=1912891 RepID=UPI002ED44D34